MKSYTTKLMRPKTLYGLFVDRLPSLLTSVYSVVYGLFGDAILHC